MSYCDHSSFEAALISLELDEKGKKIAAYKELVRKLPQANWSLLRALSAFLISIVSNSDVNKMTVRNGKHGLLKASSSALLTLYSGHRLLANPQHSRSRLLHVSDRL